MRFSHCAKPSQEASVQARFDSRLLATKVLAEHGKHTKLQHVVSLQDLQINEKQFLSTYGCKHSAIHEH